MQEKATKLSRASNSLKIIEDKNQSSEPAKEGLVVNTPGFLLGSLEMYSLGRRANLPKDRLLQRLKISLKSSQCFIGSR